MLRVASFVGLGFGVLLAVTALADHGGDSPSSRPSDLLAPKVKEIFANKCQSCHSGDGKFGDDDMPTEEWKGKVLDALNHKKGTRPMPPASANDELTDAEKKIINDWAGIASEEPKEDVCKEGARKPSPEVVKQIFDDRCVTCHGKLSINPTSVLRPAHEQFLNNDGSFDYSVLGDMSEIELGQMPRGKTSIPRILDALTNYTMPPRGTIPVLSTPSDRLLPKMGTPHMTPQERQYIISTLNQKMRADNCPVKEFVPMTFTSFGKSVNVKYKAAAKACEQFGMRMPTRKQIEDARAKSAVKAEGCVWTSTFDSDSSYKGDHALRKTLSFNQDGSSYIGWATENYKCQTLCVK